MARLHIAVKEVVFVSCICALLQCGRAMKYAALCMFVFFVLPVISFEHLR
jgi:hypothetical protein